MQYVAPMPNPDLVAGPDWTTALGSIAVGLTRGIGEGAELIQRDRAQKMQQQRDAVEQAYRDRQEELAEKRFTADEAYRGDKLAFDKSQAQNQMELSAYKTGMDAEMHAAQLENTRANTQSLVEQRNAAMRTKQMSERGAMLHGRVGGDRDRFIQQSTDELMAAYGMSPEDLSQPEARQFISAQLQPDLEAFDYYTGTARGVPDAPKPQKAEWQFKDTLEGPMWVNPFTREAIPVTGKPSDPAAGVTHPPPAPGPVPSATQIPEGAPPPAKALPVGALEGLDQPTQQLVLRALRGDPVSYAELKRNRPGLLDQILQNRKPK